MKFEAYECKEYHDGKSADLYTMKQIAWTVIVDTRGRTLGFVPPENEEE
jgi:hypothetical protein